MTKRYEGGCLCGAVRYIAEAEPLNERVCHCRLCQKALGAAFNARLLFRIEDVDIAGRTAAGRSSPELERVFCHECGTTLFSRRESMGIIGVASGTLDDPSLFAPTMHIWTSSKQPWLAIDDGLPQYEEGAPSRV